MRNTGLSQLLKDLKTESQQLDDCPSDSQMVDFVLGSLNDRDRDNFQIHLVSCVDCREEVDRLREALGWFREQSLVLDLGKAPSAPVRIADLGKQLKGALVRFLEAAAEEARLASSLLAMAAPAAAHRSGNVLEAAMLKPDQTVDSLPVRFAATNHRISPEGVLSFDFRTEDVRILGRHGLKYSLELELPVGADRVLVGVAQIESDGRVQLKAALGERIALRSDLSEQLPLEYLVARVIPSPN